MSQAAVVFAQPIQVQVHAVPQDPDEDDTDAAEPASVTPPEIDDRAGDSEADLEDARTPRKLYQVPTSISEAIVEMAHYHGIAMRDLMSPPDWMWSGNRLLCRLPWVTASTLVVTWPKEKAIALVALAILDQSIMGVLQCWYHNGTLYSEGEKPLIDFHIDRLGGKTGGIRSWTMMELVERQLEAKAHELQKQRRQSATRSATKVLWTRPTPPTTTP